MYEKPVAAPEADYAAYLTGVSPNTIEEAVDTSIVSMRTAQEYFGGFQEARPPKMKREPRIARRTPKDYFAFYQENGGWAWQRVNKTGTVVDCSKETFEEYTACVRDARHHGWAGKPLTKIGLSIRATTH
ncbi:MAG: hypothetical protein ACXWUK_11555 [Burkholderiales bacterium]